MADPKSVGGTVATALAASTTWVEAIEPIVTVVMTLLVGALTAWYTIERAIKTRRERKEQDEIRNNRTSEDS